LCHNLFYYNAIDIAITNAGVTDAVWVAHSGALAPELTVNICPALPKANLEGVFAAEAYKVSPVVVSVISGVLLAA
jgi:hypothetical protein